MAATWAGRSYAHVLFPVPHLTAPTLALLDRAVCFADGWLPADGGLAEPILVRRWRRRDRFLVLLVLGWYPLLVTVGSAHRSDRAARAALHRIHDACAQIGARPVADAELPRAVDAVRDRWVEAVAAQRAIAEQWTRQQFRTCPECRNHSAHELPLCRSCGHRFTAADDLDRDEERRTAELAVTTHEARLAALGRGDGLFADWPITAPEPGKAVVHRD